MMNSWPRLFATVAALALLGGCASEEPEGGLAVDDSGNGTETPADPNNPSDPSNPDDPNDPDDPNTPSACGAIFGEGFTVGDIAENWSLPNHVGAIIKLHDFCGKVIFYEEGSMW
jgi:hypothetical protein